MSDLIKRQEAIEALQQEIDKMTPPPDETDGAMRCGIRLARNIIENLPTKEAIPIEWFIRKRNKHSNDGFAWIFAEVLDDWRREHDQDD